MWFLRYLSRDWAVRTENPWEANMFFMPLYATYVGGNVGWMEGAAGELSKGLWPAWLHSSSYPDSCGHGKWFGNACYHTTTAPAGASCTTHLMHCMWPLQGSSNSMLLLAPLIAPAGHIKHVVAYINATYPFWQRHQGKDHFYWATNDWGVCKYPQQVSWQRPAVGGTWLLPLACSLHAASSGCRRVFGCRWLPALCCKLCRHAGDARLRCIKLG
jgi:hypothetical protein